MCFSASVSIGSGIVLGATGILALRQVRKPSQAFFAMIPGFFGIQQLAEGFLWLALTNPAFAGWEKFATYSFLFFAWVVWPIFVPFTILRLETDQRRRRILWFFLFLGLVVACYLAYQLMANGVKAQIMGRHIHYPLNFPLPAAWISGLFYFIPTVFPPFFSRIRHMWMVGITTTVSYVFTKIFFEDHLISVWCFFAAVLSVFVVHVLTSMNKMEKGALIA